MLDVDLNIAQLVNENSHYIRKHETFATIFKADPYHMRQVVSAKIVSVSYVSHHIDCSSKLYFTGYMMAKIEKIRSVIFRLFSDVI